MGVQSDQSERGLPLIRGAATGLLMLDLGCRRQPDPEAPSLPSLPMLERDVESASNLLLGANRLPPLLVDHEVCLRCDFHHISMRGVVMLGRRCRM